MKILISGGIKTNNIVEGVGMCFNSGGIDFIAVPFIEDINNIYQRGDYFDRVIIIEQSWNHDFEDTVEMNIRQRINEFAIQSADKAAFDDISFVFLAQNEESASMVFEEILPIQNLSIVLVKKPKYSIGFFRSLITTDMDKFPQEIVYKLINNDNDSKEVDNGNYTNTSANDYSVEYCDDDIMSELFGDSGDDFSDELFGSVNLNKESEFTQGENFNKDGFGDSDFEQGGSFDDEDFREDIDNIQDDEKPSFNTDDGIHDSDDFEPNSSFNDEKPSFNTDDGIHDSDDFEQNSSFNDENPSFNTDDSDGFEQNSSFNDENPSFNTDDSDGFEQSGRGEAKNSFSDSMYEVEQNEGYTDEYNPNLDNYNPGTKFDDRDYEREIDNQNNGNQFVNDLSSSQIKATLDAFANRGNSIVVTGFGGSGASTVALNLANIISKLGYTVLLVDLDTENKAQSYISKNNYECVEPDSASLMAAINSTSGINAHISIVKQGFHLLTMGLGSDSAPIENLIQPDKIARFINLAKASHNFVIYDVPFKTAVGFGKDFTFMADNLVFSIDCSNWGITKAMINMCNVDGDDMQETLFSKGQILFNRYKTFGKIMGKKVKTAIDITKVMDNKVRELIGEDPGYYFQALHICGIINENPNFESGWFGDVQVSDTSDGSQLFLDLLTNIVMKR